MRVFHVTRRSVRASIGVEGIDPSYSRGARKESWFCRQNKVAWAIIHVMERHRVNLEDVVVLEVLVSKHMLTSRWKGVYTCASVVEPLFLLESMSGTEMASLREPIIPPDQMAGG